MEKIGLFVGEHENWTFFKEIYDDLSANYQVKVFKRREFNVPLLYGRLNHLAFREGMRSLLRNNKLCFFEWASEYLMLASWMPKTCSIVTRLHAFELFVWAPKINWESVDRVILVSQSMKDKFSSLYPNQAHKADILNNGIDIDRFTPPLQREFSLELGMLCRIHPVKRIYETILMINNLKNQGLSPRLHIAGQWDTGGFFEDYFVAIKSLIVKLGLQNDVILYGAVKNPEEWLKSIDIFISNSYFEGQQVGLLEALAAGCYCLSHFWDGADEIVPPENIFITEDDLQKKIKEYCEFSSEEKNNRRALMRQIACEKFDIRKTKSKILRIIDEEIVRYPKNATRI